MFTLGAPCPKHTPTSLSLSRGGQSIGRFRMRPMLQSACKDSATPKWILNRPALGLWSSLQRLT
nr:MAG: hypothetical protein [Sanya fiers-like virus 52]